MGSVIKGSSMIITCGSRVFYRTSPEISRGSIPTSFRPINAKPELRRWRINFEKISNDFFSFFFLWPLIEQFKKINSIKHLTEYSFRIWLWKKSRIFKKIYWIDNLVIFILLCVEIMNKNKNTKIINKLLNISCMMLLLLVAELWLRTHCWELTARNNRRISWDFPPHNYLKENLCVTLGSGDSKNYLNAVLPIFKMTYNEMCTVFPERRRWDRDAP